MSTRKTTKRKTTKRKRKPRATETTVQLEVKSMSIDGGKPIEFGKLEAVDHPAHYNVGGIEVVDIADAYDLGRYEFNVVKYVLRAKRKNNEIEDLKKARWYLDRLITNLEKR